MIETHRDKRLSVYMSAARHRGDSVLEFHHRAAVPDCYYYGNSPRDRHPPALPAVEARIRNRNGAALLTTLLIMVALVLPTVLIVETLALRLLPCTAG